MRLLLAAAALLSTASAGAVTVINGNFQAQGSGFSVSTFDGPDGWTALNGDIVVVGGAAQLSRGDFGGIMQRIHGFDVGKHYRITFDVFSQSEGGYKPNRLLVSATGGGTQIYNFGASTFARAAVPLGGYSYDFVASRSISNVQFRSIGNDPLGTFIDNIQISLVPEPATWALMIAGFGLVGLFARRRAASRSITA